MKKLVSFFLTFLICINMIAFTLFSSAGVSLDDSKIYIEVDDKIYEVEYGETVTYEYTMMYSGKKISTLDARIEYPSQALKFKPYLDSRNEPDYEKMFPVSGYDTVYNPRRENVIKFNFSYLPSYDFSAGQTPLFYGEFEVITDTPGVYTINGYLETLADIDLEIIIIDHIPNPDCAEQKQLVGKTPVDLTDDPTEGPTDDTSSQTTPPTAEPSEGWTGSGPSEPFPPTEGPTDPLPSDEPTDVPTIEPTEEPTDDPPIEPTDDPTIEPTEEPTDEPTIEPTEEPTDDPTIEPTEEPIEDPTIEPTEEPTDDPTIEPTEEPTEDPTIEPTEEPTDEPTEDPEVVLLGDVDGNGQITIKDATAIQLHIAKKQMLTQEQLKRADTKKDGEITVLDATMIQLLVAKLISEF